MKQKIETKALKTIKGGLCGYKPPCPPQPPSCGGGHGYGCGKSC